MQKTVVLHVDTERLNEKVSQIKRGCEYLSKILTGLKDLGAKDITVDDLKGLMIADGNQAEIKKIILRDKVLETPSGLKIAKEAIHFDKQALADLSRVCRQAPSSLEQGDYYEIVDGQVKCFDGLEDDLRSRYTLYGTARQEDIAYKMADIAGLINELRTEIGAEQPHHPMRMPESWFTWNSRGEYVVDVYRVSKHVNP